MGKFFAIVASLVRFAAACALVWICWQDWPAQRARDAFDELPDYDAATEAHELFKQNRLTDAQVLIDEALAEHPDDNRLLVIRQGIETERKNWARSLQMGTRGAITGEGTDAASLTGAVIADLFVFGDIRDLVIQGGHFLKGEATDEVIVGLSAAGIVVTAAPSVDLGTALIKFARRMGAITDSFAHAIADVAKRAAKTRRGDELAAIAEDVTALEKRARPAGTVSILKHVNDPKVLATVSRFAQSREGLRALLIDPETTVRWLTSGWPHAEKWLLKASSKGRAGLTYLAQNSSQMFALHPLLGLVKGLYKGNVPDLLLQLGIQYSLLILGFALGWAGYELLLLLGRAAAPGVRARPGSAPAG